MDEQLVAQKLESLRRCILRVESRLSESLERLLDDLDAQDIISLNLTRAVQMCVGIAAHWLAENTKSRPGCFYLHKKALLSLQTSVLWSSLERFSKAVNDKTHPCCNQ